MFGGQLSLVVKKVSIGHIVNHAILEYIVLVLKRGLYTAAQILANCVFVIPDTFMKLSNSVGFLIVISGSLD